MQKELKNARKRKRKFTESNKRSTKRRKKLSMIMLNTRKKSMKKSNRWSNLIRTLFLTVPVQLWASLEYLTALTLAAM